MPRFLAALVFASLALVTPAHADGTSEAAWAALARGAVALIRHAETSGGAGDPPDFRLNDCDTQRLLNARGRQQAIALGEVWRRRGVIARRVMSSQWCRCVETAILMGIGPVQPFAPLNNLFGRYEASQAQVAALRPLVAEWKGPGALVLVSHGSTILAFAGVSPAEGEIVVVEPEPANSRGVRVVGRIPPPR